MELGLLFPTVRHGQPNQHVVWAGLGVLGKDVPVGRVVKDAGVLELILWLADPSPPVLLDQVPVRILRLRVLVEGLHVRVGGGGVEVVVAFLAVLPVVALWTRQTKETLLEDGVLLVPESHRETETALSVTDAQQAVLPPPIGTGASMVMREVVPAVRHE